MEAHYIWKMSTITETTVGHLMLKLQYFGHLMQRDDSLEKTLMLRKNEGRRKRRQQRMRCLDSMDMNLSKFWQTVEDREAGLAVVHEVA